MTTLREAAVMALEALNNLKTTVLVETEISVLREALAQHEPEPVAWIDRDGEVYRMPEIKNWAPPHTMLYTAPPQQQAKPFSPDSISTTQTAWKMGYEAAQAEMAEQEPFGYFRPEPFGWTDCAKDDDGAIALYEAPPQREWVDLTNEEIEWIKGSANRAIGYIRVTAAKLKEKNLHIKHIRETHENTN